MLFSYNLVFLFSGYSSTASPPSAASPLAALRLCRGYCCAAAITHALRVSPRTRAINRAKLLIFSDICKFSPIIRQNSQISLIFPYKKKAVTRLGSPPLYFTPYTLHQQLCCSTAPLLSPSSGGWRQWY